MVKEEALHHTPAQPMTRVQPTSPITYADALAARRRLAPYLTPTPLRNYPALDEMVGCRVLVKHENHQPTNVFKVRNGLAVLTGLPRDQTRRGVVAASTGNHGAGVAYAGRLVGIPVRICVPRGNNPEKNRAVRGYGATLVESGRTYDDAVATMNGLVRRRGLYAIHSTNHPLVVAGAATITLEILEQAAAMGEKLGMMVFAVGGGSQAVGAITVLREQRPRTKVFGVQAHGARAIHEAWHAHASGRQPRKLAPPRTIADGVATGQTYAVTFPSLRDGLAGLVTVTEPQIAAAIRLMIQTTHNLCEGAGAVGLAGLRKLRHELRGKTVAIVLSGSNIDQATLRRVMRRQ
jgi:threonine dehydratase